MTTSGIVLSAEELYLLTQRTQRAAQMRVLDELEVPYKRRPDGSIVVFRAAAERAATATLASAANDAPSYGVDVDAIHRIGRGKKTTAR